MGEIVNLRAVKKRRDRQATAAEAKQNRVRHGRTKAEKENDRRLEERRRELLDVLEQGTRWTQCVSGL
ncbi:MAG: DUF4169 family protein [Acetobacteraceae bacterium]